MQSIENQVLSQYLAVIRGEKSLDEVVRRQEAEERRGQKIDSEPEIRPRFSKGHFIDLMV